MKKKAISIVCIVLAFLMMVTLVVSVVGSLGALAADEQDQIDALEQQKIELQSQQASIQTNINDLMAQQADVIEQKAAMDEKNELARQEIELINEQIDVYTDLIEQKARELEKAEAAEQAQYDLYCKRVRAMEEEGSYTYLDILFQCRSLSDVLSAIDMIGEIMEYDNAVMDQLAATRKELQDQQAVLEATRADQQAEKEDLEARKADLKEKEATIDQLIADIKADENEAAKAKDALTAEANRVTSEILQKQKELQALIDAGKINFDPGSGWQWPLHGIYRITSTFGPRIHPITGRPGNHTGTDIGAPRNTPIHAARGGVVTISTYGSSYGNYVVIQHDNGIATLYAHMNSRAVKEGDVVTQDQVIGYVGTTGSSTGNHLHFEFRVNGQRADALDYYPALKDQFVYS